MNENYEEFEKGENEDLKYDEKRKKYLINGIKSIIACIIHTLGFFSIYIQKNFMVYLISYRRQYNNNLRFSHGYFLYPILNLTNSLTIPLSGVLEDKIGPKKVIIVSTLILCSSFFMLYFSKSIIFDYFLMCLNGLGIALGTNITKKNACAYFMNRKAFVYGITHLIAAFLCAGLNLFFEKIILNPLSESPKIENIYYDESIFLNYKKLIIFEIFFLICTSLITLILFIKNNPKETIKYGYGEKLESKENILGNDEMNQLSKNKRIKKAIYSKRTIKIFVMLFLFYPTIHFILNTWRPIGIYYKRNTYYLQLTTALYNISSSTASIIMTLIGDKIQFKLIFILFSFLFSFISFSFPSTFNNDLLFVGEILLVSFLFNGFNIVVGPHLMKVYGIDIYSEIGGIIEASFGIGEIICVIFAFYLENYFSGNKDSAYHYMYFISGFLSLISTFIGFFENDEKFKYF